MNNLIPNIKLCFKQHLELCKQVESLQARIDALMLEYCPDEMTKDQLKNWEDHQARSVLDRQK